MTVLRFVRCTHCDVRKGIIMSEFCLVTSNSDGMNGCRGLGEYYMLQNKKRTYYIGVNEGR